MKRCWNADANQRPNFPEILFRLEECLVEATITDSKGANFWKEHFLYPTQQLKERVEWDEFKDILIKNAKEPEKKEVATKNSSTASSRQPQPRVLPLKELLEISKDVLAFEYEDVLKRKSLVVTPEYFNKMIYTFGYFFLPETTHEVLVQIEHIIKHAQAGFMGISIGRWLNLDLFLLLTKEKLPMEFGLFGSEIQPIQIANPDAHLHYPIQRMGDLFTERYTTILDPNLISRY